MGGSCGVARGLSELPCIRQLLCSALRLVFTFCLATLVLAVPVDLDVIARKPNGVPC